MPAVNFDDKFTILVIRTALDAGIKAHTMISIAGLNNMS